MLCTFRRVRPPGSTLTETLDLLSHAHENTFCKAKVSIISSTFFQLENASDRFLLHLEAERDEIDALFAEIDASVRNSKRIYRQAAGLPEPEFPEEVPEELRAEEAGGDENVEPPSVRSPPKEQLSAPVGTGWIRSGDWDAAVAKVSLWPAKRN